MSIASRQRNKMRQAERLQRIEEGGGGPTYKSMKMGYSRLPWLASNG